jgi:tRNA(Ile)-lysidine synthase
MNTLFKLTRQKYVLACSGGADSMAALAFLRNGKHDFTVAHFHHGTKHADDALDFVVKECSRLKIPYSIGYISGNKKKGESPEEYYRHERYDFLKSFGVKIITGHHLDDCVETWLFSSINGNPKLISYETDVCLRPFLTVSKEEMKDFAKRNGMSWIEDPSNEETNIPRNCIRHELIPIVAKINKNIKTTIRHKLEEKIKKEGLKISNLVNSSNEKEKDIVECLCKFGVVSSNENSKSNTAYEEEDYLVDGWYDPNS